MIERSMKRTFFFAAIPLALATAALGATAPDFRDRKDITMLGDFLTVVADTKTTAFPI